VNSSWIVHSDLDRHAEEYLAHLESSDPPRLERSCENARALVGLRDPFGDPKAWFYAGLFSLATPDELDRFAETHWMTRAAVSSIDPPESAGFSPSALEKLRRIRDALSRLPK
jgi:hypothetical protein